MVIAVLHAAKHYIWTVKLRLTEHHHWAFCCHEAKIQTDNVSLCPPGSLLTFLSCFPPNTMFVFSLSTKEVNVFRFCFFMDVHVGG